MGQLWGVASVGWDVGESQEAEGVLRREGRLGLERGLCYVNEYS